MIRFWITALTATMLLTACGNGDEASAPAEPDTPTAASGEPAGEANRFLADVDSDTAYLYANLQRVPDGVIDKVWAMNEASAESNQAMLDALAEDDELPPEARALVEELAGLATREGWEAAGLHTNPYYAFYGAQLMPFGRFELSDGEAFAAFLGRIEAGLEEPFVRRDVGGEEVIWIELQPGFGVALHHGRDSATVALIPDDAALLARVTGEYDPADPMDASALAAFNRETGLSGYGSGFMDWRRFIDGMLAEDAPLATLYHDDQLTAIAENPACVAEYGALTEAMPRMVFGYTRMTETHMDFLARQELAPEIAGQLAPIARAPVAVDRELDGGLFNFGLGFDLIEGREFARGLVQGWVEEPPQCPSFAWFADNAPALQENLARPIPPVVTNLHGLYLEGMTLEMGENGLPTGGGTLTFFMENPQLLVGMAQMFSPAVAEMALEPGGEPLPVPPAALPQLQQAGLEAWMAMGDSSIGVAIGEEQIDALTRAIERTETDDFLMAGRIDFDIMTQLMDLAESTLEDVEGEAAAEGLAAQRVQYEQMAEVYDQGAFKIRFGDSGIEFIAETTLD